MNGDIEKIIGMAMSIPTKTATQYTKPFVCRYCNNSGKLEVIEYVGKEIYGFVAPGNTVLGYNSFFRQAYIYYQSIEPRLPPYDRFDITKETIELLTKAKKEYCPENYIRVRGYENCNQCKSNEWRK